MSKAVFLDRDGLINREAAPHQYITRWESFQFLPGVPESVRRLNMAGYLVIIVTNQRGVARGIMTMETVDDIHRRMCRELEKADAHIDGVYVCPHENGQCSCRKPQIGLFLQAEKDFSIDKEASWMVGDNDADIEAGKRYGVRSILTESLPEAVEQILEHDGGKRR